MQVVRFARSARRQNGTSCRGSGPLRTILAVAVAVAVVVAVVAAVMVVAVAAAGGANVP